MIYVDLWFTMIYPWWFSTRYFTTRNMLHFLANACARLAGTDLAAFISDALGVGHLQAATVCWVAKPNSQWISHMYTVYLYIYIQYRHHLGVSQNGGTPNPIFWSILLPPWTCGSPILRNPVSQHCPAGHFCGVHLSAWPNNPPSSRKSQRGCSAQQAQWSLRCTSKIFKNSSQNGTCILPVKCAISWGTCIFQPKVQFSYEQWW